jgi:CRISPR/Cas system Type II protein with McrA/HNH and RuvC-like nuclease domain
MFGEKVSNDQTRAERRIRAKSLEELVLFGWGEQCAYCDRVLTVFTSTIDHVIPRSRGGTDRIENLVPACKQCNLEKANLPLERFLFSRGWSGFQIVDWKEFASEANAIRLRDASLLIAYLTPHERMRTGLDSFDFMYAA